jgi:PAS domain S-box-containing protein
MDGFLTLLAVIPLIIACLSILQIYPEDLKRLFIEVRGVVLIIGIPFSLFLTRKFNLPYKRSSKEKEQELLQRTRELETVYEMGALINEHLGDLDVVLPITLKKVVNLTGYELGAIFLLNEMGDVLKMKSQIGHSPAMLQEVKVLKFNEGVSGKAIRLKQPVIVSISEYPSPRIVPILREEGVQTVVGIPLLAKGKAIGAIILSSRSLRRLSQKEVNSLESIGSQVGLAIENSLLLNEIRKSEEKYRTVVESATDGVCMIGRDYLFRYVNQRLTEITGYRQEELIGTDFRNLLDEKSRTLLADREDKRARGSKLPPHFELNFLHKDGGVRNVEISASAIKDLKGDVNIVVFLKDITDRRKAEEALRQSEEEAKQLSQENATMVEIGRIVSSTLNIEEVYERFAEEVRKLIPFDRIVINTIDIEKATVINVYIAGKGIVDRKIGEIYPLEGSGNAEMVRTKSSLLVQTEDFNVCKDHFPALLSTFQAGFRSIMNVPLFSKGRIIGGLLLRSLKPYAYTDKDVRLAERVSSQIAGAIANAQLFTERKQAKETVEQLSQENAIMAEIGRIVSSTLNIEEVYERFAEEVRKLIPFDRVSVNTMNPDRASVTITYVSGVKIADAQEGTLVTMESPFYEDIVNRRSSVLIQPRNENELAGRYPNFVRHFRAGLRSMIATPLISKDQVVGILHIQSLKPNAYTESDVRLAEKVGRQIAGAIANAQLFIERKRAEEALRQSEERYRTIIENIQDGYFEVNLAGNFTFVNDAECVTHGYSRDELIGMNNRQHTDKENAKKVFEAFNKLYRTGEPGRVLDYKIIRKDGTKAFTELSVSLIRNSEGKPIGFRGISRDITERKRAEEALQKSEEKYRTILENIEDGYYEVDLAGNLTFFNDSLCRIYGYPKEELIGMNDRQLTDQENAKKLFQTFNKVYRTGEPGKVLDWQTIRKDGTKRHVEASVSLQKDASGKAIGFRGILRDITEKKKVEEQLFQAEKLRAVGEMASGVAHDFNNALAAILGNTQLLLHTAHDEEIKETLKIIEKVAKDSGQTVRRLQDFTRKRVGQELFKVDVNAIIKDSMEMTKPKWKDEPQGREIRIEVVSNLQEIPSVSGNASELREVITNMIFNAIEAMPEGGKIEIRTFKKRRDVLIQISDTGIGITEETKKKIFEPFFTTKPFTNTGLGLSMSYGIIRRFGGEIEIESQLGQGTTFTIILPIGGEEKEEAVSPQAIDKGRRALILVIDDDEFVRNVLSRTLAQANHQVTLAESGEKGVQIFKEGKFDIVLTDLGLPGMSGWEVCRVIKETSPQTPVGMITGWGVEKNQSEMEEYGLDFFVSKPFDFNQILNVVSETMASKEE